MKIDPPCQKDSVLILDDEPHIVAALEDVLEDYYDVIGETSPRLALERIRENEAISTIICDQRMPEMTGDEFLKRAKQHTDATQILITGYADLQAVIRAVNEGNIFGYLTKPWEVKSLVSTVKGAVEACKLYRALLSEQALFEDLMRSISDGIFIKDSAGRYIRLNDAESRILGLGAAPEAIGKRLDDLLPPDVAARWSEDERPVLEGQSPSSCAVREITTAEGAKRWYAVNHAARIREDGSVAGLVGVSRDVTETQRVERMKDEFVSTVSHELRTPLTSILGSLSMLRAGVAGELPASTDQMVEICCRNGNRLLRLVNDVLDLEKIKRGGLEIDRAPVSVPELLADAVAANEGFGRPDGKCIELAEPVPPVRVEGDRGRLSQVLSNLISNALKFSPPGGRIRLRAIVRAECLRIAVIDLGGGIPPEFESRIFTSFSQADSSDARAKGGTGLGLSISRSIMDAHGGRIGYRTRRNRGSKFFIELAVLD